MCPARVFVICEGELLPKKGTTQGDPTSMGFCSLDITTASIFAPFHFHQRIQCQRGSFADDFKVVKLLANYLALRLLESTDFYWRKIWLHS